MHFIYILKIRSFVLVFDHTLTLPNPEQGLLLHFSILSEETPKQGGLHVCQFAIFELMKQKFIDCF
jgi:hypothetical protein